MSGPRRSVVGVKEPRSFGCAGGADFARLCRNLPSYLVEVVWNQCPVGNS